MLYKEGRNQAKKVSALQKKQVSSKVLSTITFCSPKLLKHFSKLKLNYMHAATYYIKFNALI